MSDITLKLGKKPAREDAVAFKLVSFLKGGMASLPTAPAVFGHYDLIGQAGMLGNDQYGDCVFAGGDHETMLWTAIGGSKVTFTDSAALSDYSAVTGFNPNDPNSDQGTDMEEAAKYRRKTGLVDGRGRRHTIDAYLELPGVSARGANNPATLLPAIASSAYVFGAIGIGIEFPESAMQQFNAGQPWSIVKGSPIQGGHYVPLVGRRANGNYVVITWGELQEVTPAFLTEYVDEAIAYVSIEQLKNGKNLEGFDLSTLQADLAALSGVTPAPAPTPVPTPTPTPTPVTDPNVQALDTWAAGRHVGANAAAAKAWKAVKASHNL
jgi:hypothetical protein